MKDHNNRDLLKEGTYIEKLILIEADYLDEFGVMTVLRDSMAEGSVENQSYEKTHERIKKHCKKSSENIMVTKTARKMWIKRWKILDLFVSELAEEIFG